MKDPGVVDEKIHAVLREHLGQRGHARRLGDVEVDDDLDLRDFLELRAGSPHCGVNTIESRRILSGELQTYAAIGSSDDDGLTSHGAILASSSALAKREMKRAQGHRGFLASRRRGVRKLNFLAPKNEVRSAHRTRIAPS